MILCKKLQIPTNISVRNATRSQGIESCYGLKLHISKFYQYNFGRDDAKHPFSKKRMVFLAANKWGTNCRRSGAKAYIITAFRFDKCVHLTITLVVLARVLNYPQRCSRLCISKQVRRTYFSAARACNHDSYATTSFL